MATVTFVNTLGQPVTLVQDGQPAYPMAAGGKPVVLTTDGVPMSFLTPGTAAPWRGVTVVSTSVAAAASVSITGVLAGDLILMAAHRTSSATAPTVPVSPAWTSLGTVTGGSRSTRLARFVATANGTLASGTFTNASRVRATVLRGTTTTGTVGGAHATTTARPFTSISITPGSYVWGFFAISSGTPPLPEIAPLQTLNAGANDYTLLMGPFPSYAPPAGATGSSLHWADALVEVIP